MVVSRLMLRCTSLPATQGHLNVNYIDIPECLCGMIYDVRRVL